MIRVSPFVFKYIHPFALSKGKRMNILENYYIQRGYLQNNIIIEQTINKLNPLFRMAMDIESRDKVGNHDSVRLQPDETVSQQPHADHNTRTTQGRQSRQNNKTTPQ